MMLLKDKPVRSERLRRSAQGQPCTLRLPGICEGDSATTVLAHPPVANGGMSIKGSDLDGAFACARCHDVLDKRQSSRLSLGEIYECWIRGAQETRAIWVQQGLVSVRGITDG